eukprot:590118-Rhodomonas_salina.1
MRADTLCSSPPLPAAAASPSDSTAASSAASMPDAKPAEAPFVPLESPVVSVESPVFSLESPVVSVESPVVSVTAATASGWKTRTDWKMQRRERAEVGGREGERRRRTEAPSTPPLA